MVRTAGRRRQIIFTRTRPAISPHRVLHGLPVALRRTTRRRYLCSAEGGARPPDEWVARKVRTLVDERFCESTARNPDERIGDSSITPSVASGATGLHAMQTPTSVCHRGDEPA